MKIHTFLSVYLFYFQRFGYVFLAATRLLCYIASLHVVAWSTLIGNLYKKVKALNMIASMNGRMLSAPDAVIL